MIKHNNPLVAFISVLVTIVILTIAATVVKLHGGEVETIGIGAAITGLIGVLGTFRPKADEPKL